MERFRSCTTCGSEKELWSMAPMFVCTVCVDVELCLRCFCAGAEPGQHSRTHGTRVRAARRPVVAPGWSGAEDLGLLHGVETHGLGNWGDVASGLPRKTASACEAHYWQEYAARFGVAEPRRALDHRTETWAAVGDTLEADAGPAVEAAPGDVPLRRAAPPRGTLFRKAVPVATLSDAALAASRAALAGSALAGYMPLRGDFDVEHDNDAELLIADMELRADEAAGDRAVKRRVLEMYAQRLNDREARKRFVIDRGLLDAPGRRADDAAVAPGDRALAQQVRAFARFQAQGAHDAWVAGLADAARLRATIARLESYRGAGLETLADVDAMEADRARASVGVRSRRRRERDAVRRGGTAEERRAESALRAQSSAARERRSQQRAGAGGPEPAEQPTGRKRPRGDNGTPDGAPQADGAPRDDGASQADGAPRDDSAPRADGAPRAGGAPRADGVPGVSRRRDGADVLAPAEVQACDAFDLECVPPDPPEAPPRMPSQAARVPRHQARPSQVRLRRRAARRPGAAALRRRGGGQRAGPRPRRQSRLDLGARRRPLLGLNSAKSRTPRPRGRRARALKNDSVFL
ncbi:hypothetical protein M885DRAFT_553219 [Pelagophyceae sp. CCMP2097]|nr:hypothetical protein M885DRAFT_553219 [Pelagophyceae sp. CCMP2097]